MSCVPVRVLASIAFGALPALALAQPTAPLPLKHAPQPTSPAITAADLMTRLYIFADDSMMGREAGTPWNLKGTAYIEREVRRMGLIPGGDSGTFFQNLPIFNHPMAADNTIIVDAKTFRGNTDYVARDNRVFGPVRGFDGVTTIYGGVYSPEGDTTKMVSPAAAAGKFVVIGVPNGPDGKPIWGGNRQQLTGYYLDAAGVAVVSLDYADAQTRSVMFVPTQTFDAEEAAGPTVPAFMYVSQAMGDALMGGTSRDMARGTAGRAVHGTLKWDNIAAPARNVVAILPGSDPKLRLFVESCG